MKILALHVDYIKFKPLKKALKSVGELSANEKKGGEMKDALVVMTSVEKGDGDVGKLVGEYVKNVKDIAGQVKTKNVVLYPYVHLSSNPSSPDVALKVLDGAEKELRKNFKVARAPFGYYKEFEMKVKGHPLSELSREIRVGGGEEVVDEAEIQNLAKKLTKVKMSTKKAPKGLKTNIELGRDLDLYIINEVVGGGLPLFTPKGATIKREIERFAIDEELKRGYVHTDTPVMAKSDLYKISGHWQHYKDDMFKIQVGKEIFALRPMTCPFQFILYKRKPRSHKELPIRYAEVAELFRNEQSGELRGLTRVREFSFADAHLICKPNQIEKEFEEVLNLMKYVVEKVGLDEKDFWYRFSRWDPKEKGKKYIDNPQAWKMSEKMMKKILDKLKLKYVEAKDEAAFYGPKLDVQYKDVFGKEDTMFTIQIDFALPEKYDLTYKDEKNKEVRPMVIHRSSTGATVRLMSMLLEKTQGNLKLWLSPVQVKVLSMTKDNIKYAKEVRNKLFDKGIRVENDLRDESISKKVRDALTEKVYYLVTVGDKEEKNGNLAVRTRDSKKIEDFSIEEFGDKVKKEIENRK